MTHEWIRTKMPVLLTFSLGDDQWLRDGIRGVAGFDTPQSARVIVQGTEEGSRVARELANRKVERNKPYGGALMEAFRGF